MCDSWRLSYGMHIVLLGQEGHTALEIAAANAYATADADEHPDVREYHDAPPAYTP